MEFIKKYWIELIGALILLSSLVTYFPKVDSVYGKLSLIVLFGVAVSMTFVYRQRLEKKRIAQIGKEEQGFMESVDKLSDLADESAKGSSEIISPK
jgi:uncharacterized membrane-anchored protein